MRRLLPCLLLHFCEPALKFDRILSQFFWAFCYNAASKFPLGIIAVSLIAAESAIQPRCLPRVRRKLPREFAAPPLPASPE